MSEVNLLKQLNPMNGAKWKTGIQVNNYFQVKLNDNYLLRFVKHFLKKNLFTIFANKSEWNFEFDILQKPKFIIYLIFSISFTFLIAH